ncbi:MAG: SMC-Scp complex subunit ScpB [Candidatus Moranbacteria bacterium]|nr:SMC-Scp complex subunit ScpB [Candidatus Moranbacteria bacterium]
MDQKKLKSIIESILFISGEPLSLSRISKVTGASEEEIETALGFVVEDYSDGRGVVVIRKEDKVEMATSPENAEIISELVKSEIQENLSPAALEVLSIIAYRGPIARVEIESIRGVNCSFTLRSLLMRSLIERVDNPKDSRGYLYKISFQFLESLGMPSVEKLPDFDNLSKDTRIESVLVKEEDGKAPNAETVMENIADESK